ncbi:MAG: septum formation inhibitor Maf [Syntrophomonadaceae bacterium]|nr:septum formation inhibitor Maf [Syntrophomonadaceae bacterium]
MKKVILASASPRRATLLYNLGLNFTIVPAAIDESILPHEKPVDAVMRIAAAKAEAAGSKNPDAIVIAADTVVVCKGQILGKPVDDREAFMMLSTLSGDVHEVITGLCVLDSTSGMRDIDFEKTLVRFRELDKEEIEAYIASGEPQDKAGAYGIQGRAAIFVAGLEGCYYNVVGLPLSRLYMMLKRQGLCLLESGIGERIQNRHQGPA